MFNFDDLLFLKPNLLPKKEIWNAQTEEAYAKMEAKKKIMDDAEKMNLKAIYCEQELSSESLLVLRMLRAKKKYYVKKKEFFEAKKEFFEAKKN